MFHNKDGFLLVRSGVVMDATGDGDVAYRCGEDFILTREDIAEAIRHEDYIVYDAHFNFDVHNITGASLDKTGCQHKFTQKKGYTIPYGCFVPKEIDGLLLAGRCISGTHMAHSSYRAMPICVGMGEGVGAAAALAIRNPIEVREISPRTIQECILKSN